nr:hypothetical protein [Brucella anthropi]
MLNYANDYETIADKIDNKQSVEFVVERRLTAFVSGWLSSEWQTFRPTRLPKKELSEIYSGLTTSPKDRFTRHELNVDRDGGTTYYRENEDNADFVDVKVVF